MTVKRYTPRKTPYTEMWAARDGEYVRHEDYAALEAQLEAIGAGGVGGQRATSRRQQRSDYWKDALDHELIMSAQVTTDDYTTAGDAVRALIEWHVTAAQDPQINGQPFCEECSDGIMAHDPGICGTCYCTKYAPSCDMDEHACNHPSQCWEPCGELGKSAKHAMVAPDHPPRDT